jgi:hypothetical protein
MPDFQTGGLKAFSSEVAAGSRQENVSKKSKAFSSEVAAGPRQENASKQKYSLVAIRPELKRPPVPIGFNLYFIINILGQNFPF